MRSKASRADRMLGADWIWPHWLERQLDPHAPAYVPPTTSATPENVTLRNWTAVATIASSHRALVDPRGLLTPRRGGWSLDWWILGEDRWHFPSRDAAVRQQLVDDTPVVETTMRIRGGDAVHRAYAVPSPQPMAIVEVTNRTTTPIAVVFSIRPYNPEGKATVEGVTLHDQTVRVDGQSALLLPKRPSGAISSTLEQGDVVHRVIAEDTGGAFPTELRCPDGLATAAFVFPLAHTATLRVGLPLDGEISVHRRRRTSRSEAPDVSLGSEVATSDDVVRSWRAQTSSRGLRLVVPEGRLASAIEANRRFLLALHEGDESDSSVEFTFRDASDQLGVLDLYGFSAEVDESIRRFPSRLRVDGRFLDDARDADASAAALQTMAAHWRLTASLEVVDADAVARSARWIERRRSDDSFWSLRGLIDAAALLAALGEDRLADECRAWADRRQEGLRSSMTRAAERLSTPVVPVTPSGRIDADVLDALAVHTPLELVAADDPSLTAVADAVRERSCVASAVFRWQGDRSGLVPSLTAQLAEVELAAGDPRCLDRLAWLVESATATFTWPEVIHPGVGGGSGGDGHHGPTAAAFLRLVRRMLVREVDNHTLALCTMLPEAWRGQNIEVHDAPTRLGRLSFAVRWHDDRPALLWDLKVRTDDARLQITAPGLDAGWSTNEAKGEALLAPAPGMRPPATEGSFS